MSHQPFFVCVSLSPPPVSDAAGYNRVYLGAGLDHLSGHGGKHLPELPGKETSPSTTEITARQTRDALVYYRHSHLLELKLPDKRICVPSDIPPTLPARVNGLTGAFVSLYDERSGGDNDPAQLCDTVSVFWSWRLQISDKKEDYVT